jgi:hypothetical protein
MNKLALKSAMMMGAILDAIRKEPLPEITERLGSQESPATSLPNALPKARRPVRGVLK